MSLSPPSHLANLHKFVSNILRANRLVWDVDVPSQPPGKLIQNFSNILRANRLVWDVDVPYQPHGKRIHIFQQHPPCKPLGLGCRCPLPTPWQSYTILSSTSSVTETAWFGMSMSPTNPLANFNKIVSNILRANRFVWNVDAPYQPLSKLAQICQQHPPCKPLGLGCRCPLPTS